MEMMQSLFTLLKHLLLVVVFLVIIGFWLVGAFLEDMTNQRQMSDFDMLKARVLQVCQSIPKLGTETPATADLDMVLYEKRQLKYFSKSEITSTIGRVCGGSNCLCIGKLTITGWISTGQTSTFTPLNCIALNLLTPPCAYDMYMNVWSGGVEGTPQELEVTGPKIDRVSLTYKADYKKTDANAIYLNIKYESGLYGAK